MDSATHDLYYQQLTELVYDEDKIVTCMYLALQLKITLADAKSLISELVKDRRNVKPDDLNVTYLISGNLNGTTKGSVIHLVKEENLKSAKQDFSAISKEIIYSVQKSTNVDLNVIAISDESAIAREKEGAILPLGTAVSKNCVKRKLKPVKTIPVVAKPHSPPPKSAKTAKPSIFKNVPPKKSEEKVATTETVTSTSTQAKTQSTKAKSKPVGGIASFFSKTPSQGSFKSSKSEDNEQKEVVKTKNENVPPNISETAENGVKEDLLSDPVCEIMDVDVIVPSPVKGIKDQAKKSTPPSQSKNKKKRRKDNKNDLPTKKRKRIQQISDSESSDIFDNEESDDVIDKSDDDAPPVPAVTVKNDPPPKNKKRKAVDKTFMDDEGFIVTSTEYVYETASEEDLPKKVEPKMEERPKILMQKKSSTTDSENDVKATKKAKKNGKPVIGKQSSLMSFFKKA